MTARPIGESPARIGRAGDRTRRSGLSRRHREWLAAYLFLAPDVVGIVVFLGIPMVLALGLGFFEANGFGDYAFVGLANYRKMFADPLFRVSAQVTVTYTAVLVPGIYIVGLALALLLRRSFRFIGVVRGMFFLPHVVSLVVVGVVWKFMLIDRIGVANKLLRKIGLEDRSWLGEPGHALGTVLVVTLWYLMGYYMVIFLSGLQAIPQEYYDAARIDGAGPWATFWRITLPLLKPTSFFVILVSLVAAVAGGQGFDLIYTMTQGGPANHTSLLTYFVYEQAFLFGAYGYAAAVASFLVVSLLAATVTLLALTKGGRFDFD